MSSIVLLRFLVPSVQVAIPFLTIQLTINNIDPLSNSSRKFLLSNVSYDLQLQLTADSANSICEKSHYTNLFPLTRMSSHYTELSIRFPLHTPSSLWISVPMVIYSA